MKKLFCIAVISLAVTSAAFSQTRGNEYQNSIGLRLGTGYYDVFSASFKTFLGGTPSALEFNLGFRPDSYYGYDAFSVCFQAVYQYHFNIPPVPGLKWFVGGGLTFSNTSLTNKNSDYNYSSGFGMGIFPTGGLDYKFANIPLALSADLRPTIGIARPNDYYNFNYVSFGISARYTIN
jgi:hypothetical protein